MSQGIARSRIGPYPQSHGPSLARVREPLVCNGRERTHGNCVNPTISGLPANTLPSVKVLVCSLEPQASDARFNQWKGDAKVLGQNLSKDSSALTLRGAFFWQRKDPGPIRERWPLSVHPRLHEQTRGPWTRATGPVPASQFCSWRSLGGRPAGVPGAARALS